MKKIDNWLSIQRYVSEASQVIPLPSMSNVEVWGTVRRSSSARKNRRFFVPRITTI
jgi:hypothetical protein